MSSDQGGVEPIDRRAVVAELMSAQREAGEAATSIALLNRLCKVTAHHLHAAGVAVGLMSESGSAGVAASADERSHGLDELQFTLGEGPSHDAFAARRPVLIADLGSSNGQVWPAYSAGALESGIRGVFAFPLHIGATAFGAFTIYMSDVDALDQEQLKMALAFAEVATELFLDADAAPADGSLHPGVERVLRNRAEVYQAQGAVTVQLGVSLTEALVRMRAHAFAHDQSLGELATLIMSGKVILELAIDE